MGFVNRCLLLLCACAGSLSGQANAGDAIREGYIKIQDGTAIHYLQSGKITSSRALVLIPGWRLPAFLWAEQLEKFSHTARVIAVDSRSQGQSTKTANGNSPETRAKDFHELLVKLGVSSPVLVGWSQGAQDVAAYIQEFGTESVAGVVFVDSVVSAGPAELDRRKEFSKSMLAGMSTYSRFPKEYSEGMVRYIFKKPLSDEDFLRIVGATLQTPTDTGIAMLAMDMFGADRRPALAKLSKPALVIASADSPELAEQKEMAATIPGAKFLAIEDTGHAVFVDQPKQFDEALGSFLHSLPQ